MLTGSANPADAVRLHSGAGRFTTLDMRTMSWQELGHSSGVASLACLLYGDMPTVSDKSVPLEAIAERLVIGGFPGLLGASETQAFDVNRAYLDLIAETDISRISGMKRDPQKVYALIRSLARNTATLAEVTTLAADVGEREKADISRPTVTDYLAALDRLMILENQPAWDAHLRSSASLRKAPKRHFADPCLAAAALGADSAALLNDLLYMGFLFESLATHDLRIYAQANDARVFHYRDSSDLEVDAIVQKQNGDWCAFEIKLGTGQIDSAAENLKKLVTVLDPAKTKSSKSLNIITGTGISYRRADGINVLSIAALGA